MEITIDAREYLNDEEIKRICRAEVQEAVRRRLEREESLTRILTNAAYKTATDMANERLGEPADKIIADKVHEVISTLTSYTVFQSDTSYSRKSLAQQYLDGAVERNRGLIEARVKEVIAQCGADIIERIFVQYARDAMGGLDNIVSILESREMRESECQKTE